MWSKIAFRLVKQRFDGAILWLLSASRGMQMTLKVWSYEIAISPKTKDCRKNGLGKPKMEVE